MGFLKKTDYNATVAEIEKRTPSISGLATTSAFNEIENKIPDVSSLVKKKQIQIQKLLKLKKNLPIMIMIKILLPQNLII